MPYAGTVPAARSAAAAAAASVGDGEAGEVAKVGDREPGVASAAGRPTLERHLPAAPAEGEGVVAAARGAAAREASRLCYLSVVGYATKTAWSAPGQADSTRAPKLRYSCSGQAVGSSSI